MPRCKGYIPEFDDTDMRACKALYMGGYELTAISRDAGVNINTLKDWAKKGRWIDERIANTAALLKRKPPEKAPVAKVLAAAKASNVERFVEKTGKIAAEDAEYWDEGLNPETRLAHAPNIAALNKAHRSNLGLDKEEVGERGHISLSFLNSPDSVKLIVSESVKQIEDAKEIS